ncbi:MAG: RIP metalloprotease RseP, partial [Patescibacteria group bacterium]|nr:RIP metalloprotease RseP [Patescibacteria group bacterium]
VVVAGVVMNFILALFIISYLFAVVGVATPGANVQVGAIVKNSPADKAGLKPGDLIISVDNIKVSDPQQIISYTKKHLGEQMTLVIQTPDKKSETLEITPRIHYPSNEGAMGIAIGNTIIVKKYPWYIAPIVGTKETLSETWLIIQGLGGALGQLIFSHSVPKDVAGPIGIAELTGQTIKVGFDAVLSLVALLSLNLAIMNILPIPALDGGRLFFILIEVVTRRKVHPKFEGYAHAIGMAILLTLVALISFNDVYKWLMHQPLIP